MKAKSESSILGVGIENNSEHEVPDSLILKIAEVRQELIDLNLALTVTIIVRNIDLNEGVK